LRPSTNYGRACATTAWEQNYAASTRLGNFIVDFISLEARLVAGIDGSHHHRNADGLADLQRTQYLEVG
jgi:very-short-patch-repair endonuclease